MSLLIKQNPTGIAFANGKITYRSKGLEGLLAEGRGGNRPGALNKEQKSELAKKLSNPKGSFTSYKQAADWINATFGVDMTTTQSTCI